MDRKVFFVDENSNFKLVYATSDWLPVIELNLEDSKKGKEVESEIINLSEFTDLMKYKAKGKKLSKYSITKINVLESLPFDEEIEEQEEEIEQETEEITLDNNNEHGDEDFIQGSLF